MTTDSSLSSAYWLGLVHRFQAEGGALDDFCNEVGVSPSDFRKWARLFKQQTQRSHAFVPVSLQPAANSLRGPHAPETTHEPPIAIEIELPGAVVRVSGDQETLRTVLLTLKEHAC